MSNDININESAILETLNAKIDYDGGNYPNSGLETYIDKTLDNRYDNKYLNKFQITNYITEIPQRIKLELNDGVLTLKAGSIVTVPYGTEDRTAEFPVGSTFLNDYFKVYETRFANGKFFVYAQNITDITNGEAHTGATTTTNFINMLAGSIYRTVRTESGTGSPSTTYCGYYNTNTNLIKASDSTTSYVDTVLTLPLCIASTTASDTTWYGTIKQIYNSMGNIGSCWWVDKGVKYVVANGRNEDETLKNIEIVTENILLHPDSIGSSTPQERIGFLGIDINTGKPLLSARLAPNCFEQSTMPTSLNIYTGFSGYWYNPETNKQYVCSATTGTPNWLDSHIGVPIIKYDLKTGSSLLNVGDFRKPFRAVDYNDLQNGTRFRTVVETYVNGTSWYRVWSDGWCEQGGVSTGANELTVTLLKPYKDTKYSVLMTYDNSTSTSTMYINNNSAWDKTINSFKQRGAGSSISKQWEAKGYIS